MVFAIDTGTRGALGACGPQDFAINKEVPFSILENALLSALKVSSPKFEMLPMSLVFAKRSPLLEF